MFAFQLLSTLTSRLWRRPRSQGRRPVPRPTAVPRLESLEERNVPTAFGNQALVATLYQGFLGRNADPAGLAFWGNALNSGSTPLQVASGILSTAEFRGREVAGLFQPLLGRAPDLGGLNAFAGALGGGTSPAQVTAQVLASDEFFSRVGGTPQGFLNAVFQDVLNRPPDATAQAVFGGMAGAGQAGRLAVATQVVGSTEAVQDRLALDYQELLGRPIDPQGLAFWTSALQGGARDEAVLAGLVSSTEFVGKVEAASAAGGDANQVASQFIASNALFAMAPPVNTSTPATAALVQSPPFGAITFPAGFNDASAASLGTFGPNGFVPAGSAAQAPGTTSGATPAGATTAVNNTGAAALNSSGLLSPNAGLGFALTNSGQAIALSNLAPQLGNAFAQEDIIAIGPDIDSVTIPVNPLTDGLFDTIGAFPVIDPNMQIAFTGSSFITSTTGMNPLTSSTTPFLTG